MNDAERLEKLSVPPGKLRLVIDSDAKNEIDDQFAIAWALRSPERFQVEAVYAAPFSHTVFQHNLGNYDYPVIEVPEVGMEQSYEEIRRIYEILQMDPTGKVFRGARTYLNKNMEPVQSEAVTDLIERGMKSSETLYVASIGACTNVASALLQEPVFAKLGEKYKKSPAQIILRWHIQSGNIVIPGSKNPAHIRDNFDLFDFALTEDEMTEIAALDQNKRYYTSTPELLASYVSMVPPVDDQK